jgi:hypothetical protein
MLHACLAGMFVLLLNAATDNDGAYQSLFAGNKFTW